MSIMYKNVVPTLQKAHFIHITKGNILMLLTVFFQAIYLMFYPHITVTQEVKDSRQTLNV